MRVMILMLVVSGCATRQPADIQPLVAASGRYALLAKRDKPAVCETCGGRKVVGDGRIEVPCPACQPAASAACPCGGRGYITKDGKNWACGCRPLECKDGKCTIAR